MFGFSKKDKNPLCPIPDERRQWLEHAFEWLTGEFGEQPIRRRRVLIPHHSDFPIRYNGDHQSAHESVAIVARQMEIDPGEIELLFYKEGVDQLDSGGALGNKLYMGESKSASGRYFGKADDGKYHIGLEEKNLRQPEFMVATLAHELAHIKLLGEERLEENDEQLTDLTTIAFGLGVFNANAVFTTFQDFQSHGWQKLGYLKQMDWGYVLALFAQLRGESDPEWAKHLCKNVRSDFVKSCRYLVSAK
jgi:hypothetical protein